jgi:hypothetical protein
MHITKNLTNEYENQVNSVEKRIGHPDDLLDIKGLREELSLCFEHLKKKRRLCLAEASSKDDAASVVSGDTEVLTTMAETRKRKRKDAINPVVVNSPATATIARNRATKRQIDTEYCAEGSQIRSRTLDFEVAIFWTSSKKISLN